MIRDLAVRRFLVSCFIRRAPVLGYCHQGWLLLTTKIGVILLQSKTHFKPHSTPFHGTVTPFLGQEQECICTFRTTLVLQRYRKPLDRDTHTP